MSGVITAAVIVGAVSIGTAAYSADQQKKAAKKAEEEQERLREEEEARLREIAMNTKPEEETATIEFGKETTDEQGSYQDFMFKPKSSALGSSGAAPALTGSGSVTSLGF